jgi:UDP-GlcNAc:undecaprenyl-phosphate GlcNAc-1-phosphate transferase
MNLITITPELRIILTFILSIVLTLAIIPGLVKISKSKGLVAKQGPRTAHAGAVPNLGGVALFMAIMFTSWIFWDVKMIGEFQFKVVCVLIIFVLGLLDDVINISPAKKFGGQIIAFLVLIFLGNVRLTSLQGYLGIFEINYISSLLLSLFVFILIVNAFNLIDGIDGLAAGVGLVTTVTFGAWFWLAGYVQHCVLAAAVAGSLLVFFYFNVFSKKYKIFMGDTGALMIGAILAIFTIQFNQQNIDQSKAYAVFASPAVSMGILIIPLFDTLRVFTLRVLKKKSPFSGDKSHLHHMLLNLGLSHFQATLVIVLINLFFIGFVFYFQSLRPYLLLFVGMLLVLMLLFVWILSHLLKKKQ